MINYFSLRYTNPTVQKFVLISICSFLYLSLFSQYGFNLWDEGVLLNGANRVVNGDVPLVDFNGYPPGRYYFVQIFYEIFGQNVLAVRMGVSFLTALAVSCLYGVSKRIMGYPYLIFPPLLFLLAPSVYYNRFFPIATIINMFVLVELTYSQSVRWVWIGVATVLATFFVKAEIGCISFLLLLLVLLFRKGDKPFLVIGSIVFFTLFFSLFFVEYGKEAFYQVFETHAKWGNSFPPVFSIHFWTNPFKGEFFEGVLFYFPLLVYLYVFLMVCVDLLKGEKITEEMSGVIIILFFGVAVYGLVIWRAGFDNLVRVLPPAFVLFFYVFEKKTSGGGGKAVGFLMSVFVAWYSYNMVFKRGFYVGSIGELSADHTLIDLDRAGVYSSHVEALWVEEVVRYLEGNTETDDVIFSIPLNPVWYFLSERKNPTPYEWILPGTIKSGLEEIEVVKRLRLTQPKVVIYADIAIDNVESRRFSNYAKLVYGYISTNYVVVKQVGFFKIMMLKCVNSKESS